MNTYFDIRAGEFKRFRSVITQVFGHACQRLGIKLNEGYDGELEERRVISASDRDSLNEQLEENNKLHQNRIRFEDDVMTYLLLKVLEFDRPGYQTQMSQNVRCYESDVFERADSAKNDLEKIAVYRDNGDFLLLSMSVGTIGTTPVQKSRSQTYYGFASALSQRRFGRDSAQFLVFEKLAKRFDRYFAITSEVFQEAFMSARLKSDDIGISEEHTVNTLLDKLNQASSEEDRNKIKSELRRLIALS